MAEVKVNKHQAPLVLKYAAGCGKDLVAAFWHLNTRVTAFLGQKLELHCKRLNHD